MGPARADDDALTAWLERLGERGLVRRTRVVAGPQGARSCSTAVPSCCSAPTTTSGSPTIPRVRRGGRRRGRAVGRGRRRVAADLGHAWRCTDELEDRLAEFKRTEAALLFGSGYLANIGVVRALAGAGDAWSSPTS